MSTEEPYYFYANGIDGNTGEYLLDPLTGDALAAAAVEANRQSTEDERDLLRANGGGAHYGLDEGIERGDLAQTGWGVIFPRVAEGSNEALDQAAIYEALYELIDHRRVQASRKKAKYFREFKGAEGYRLGQGSQGFLANLGYTPGSAANPRTNLPYYLLLVGSPVEIPFEFQYQLDVTYAVGRLHFETPEGRPDLDAYKNYARSVVEAETSPPKRSREVGLFGVRNAEDVATTLSRDFLLAPLFDTLQEEADETPGWTITPHFDEKASKVALRRLINDGAPPALLFTASHGLDFGGDRARLGALLCSDWRRTSPLVAPREDEYFCATDVDSGAKLHGMIVFNFACFSAGTPMNDAYAHLGKPLRSGGRIADRPFVSRLHQKLLGRPGGALAAIGHIERAWADSFPKRGDADADLGPFRSAMKVLMKGLPVGAAMQYFNDRYAVLGAALSSKYDGLFAESSEVKRSFASIWRAHNDARDYVVNGDPAARLTFADP